MTGGGQPAAVLAVRGISPPAGVLFPVGSPGCAVHDEGPAVGAGDGTPTPGHGWPGEAGCGCPSMLVAGGGAGGQLCWGGAMRSGGDNASPPRWERPPEHAGGNR